MHRSRSWCAHLKFTVAIWPIRPYYLWLGSPESKNAGNLCLPHSSEAHLFFVGQIRPWSDISYPQNKVIFTGYYNCVTILTMQSLWMQCWERIHAVGADTWINFTSLPQTSVLQGLLWLWNILWEASACKTFIHLPLHEFFLRIKASHANWQ